MARIAIVEDTDTTAHWLRRLLEMEADLHVVATAKRVSQQDTIVQARPDIVLVDRILEDGDGSELAGSLAQRLPAARVYLYTSLEPPTPLPEHVGWLRVEDMHLWRRFLTEPPERSALLVKHPA